ncbi:rRNA maturation RNase YbeY [Lachnoclostridium sp. MSJ-17]|uniref:rRNA maturation RNase YbeY n=1 Tax=Lachnoclostridium sp. MSJ-17 TaxID=2841516 RepID=UPI001C0FC2E8|nr:rRNA maturation RNase YbeY [Lachnoclostridium sp. MSJ-17]MBU5461935.1 rRNA maturation RNase YbeY [Lachnoclostridium sp. MSJ-17]
MTEKIKVVITDIQKTVKVPKGLRMLIRRCCLATLRLQGFSGSTEIDVIFTDNDEIRKINEKFFGGSSVASMLYKPMNDDGVLGAVYVSLERAGELAQTYFSSLQREAVYLTVLGVLGILGCDPEDEGSREREEMIMYELGFPMSTSYILSK